MLNSILSDYPAVKDPERGNPFKANDEYIIVKCERNQ